MAIYLGAIENNSIYFGGTTITNVYLGTIEVWTNATPYTVAFLDYPIAQTAWDGNGEKYMYTASNGYSIQVKKNPNVSTYGSLTSSVTLPTQGCNKVRIGYTATATDAKINYNSVVRNGSYNEIVLDCTGSEFELVLQVVEGTGASYASMFIGEVSFYSE